MIDLIALQAEITARKKKTGKKEALDRAKKRYGSSLLGWKELKHGFIFYVTDSPESGTCTACHWIDYGDGIRFKGGAAVSIPENMVKEFYEGETDV